MKKYQYQINKSYGIHTEKQNKQYEINHEYSHSNHIKSTTSTNQQSSYPRSSTDNLYIHRLQSTILELQKQIDQQQFQLQTLTQESNIYMRACQEQKQVIMSLNIQALKAQYEQQVAQMILQKQKAQEIIVQLRQDYQQTFYLEQNQLQEIKCLNLDISKQISQELDQKKNILSLLAGKDKKIQDKQKQIEEAEERLDQLRNIQRKLTIAIKQLQRLRNQ